MLINGPRRDKWFTYLASQFSFATLLNAGVVIRLYRPSMLHAKIATIDGDVAFVGSANLNGRSLFCDEELNLVLLDSDTVGELNRQFDLDVRRSDVVRKELWAERSWVRRIAEVVASQFAGYL